MTTQHDYDGIQYREEQRSPAVFRGLFLILVVWGLCFIGYYLFSGWSSQRETDAAIQAREARKNQALTASESTAAKPENREGAVAAYVAKGKQVYQASCAGCHGEAAKGGVGPDLTASTYKFGKSRAEIGRSISEGRPGGMPAFGTQLGHEQIEALVEYLLSLK